LPADVQQTFNLARAGSRTIGSIGLRHEYAYWRCEAGTWLLRYSRGGLPKNMESGTGASDGD
jgi:hypothetical protein